MTISKSVRSILIFFTFFSCLAVNAQTANDDSTEHPYSLRVMFNGSTSPRHFNNHYTVTPPEGFILLDAENSRKFLVDLCGNPASSADGVKGCIVPDVDDIYVDGIPYFFVIGEDMCGYVKDNDASTINYTDLLIEMQKDGKAENEEYRKTHPEYPIVTLVGWAEPPYYDKTTHTLYWGKMLDFQQETKTINYDMRVLGKDGFVLVQAVGDEYDLAELKNVGQQMLGNISFDSGYTYGDFDESRDHIAEWTIGGLVAGKILTKVGFWAVIAKFWKIILVALLGGFGAVKAFFGKFFKRRNDDDDDFENYEGQETGVKLSED